MPKSLPYASDPAQRSGLELSDDTFTADVNNQTQAFYFSGREGKIAISCKTDWKAAAKIAATGDTDLGKGVLGAIPLHLLIETSDLQLANGKSLSWEITFELIK